MQRLNELAISDAGFVFDPWSGATFNVNPTAKLLLDGLKAGEGRVALMARVRNGFEVSALTDLRRDVDEFIGLLKEFGLLDRDFALSDAHG
ncbi:PqqD family protein [Myxococcota bacterium]|nr:PqqD family protein [Myxococcota bacterium]MBU1429544.1 PqqD family protein [Myxococcota bacterium]MBU1896680.1 PqqD family protein [Myxococcota bacterium]